MKAAIISNKNIKSNAYVTGTMGWVLSVVNDGNANYSMGYMVKYTNNKHEKRDKMGWFIEID